MLPLDAKRNTESYSYPNGMLNIGWIAGVLRHPGNGTCFIQQTASENHMIPIEFDPRKSPIPRDVKELDIVMAYCHVIGFKDGDQRSLRLRAIRFEAANTMHMDKRFIEDLVKKWETKVHDAAKRTATPEAIKALQAAQPQSIQERLSAFDWRVMQMNRNASNQVRLAGFVQAKSLERNRVIDGKPVNDRLIVLLRQTEDPDKCIPIRWYSRNLEPLANMLRRGLPISVSGEVRLDVKAVGAPDPETGVAPVSKVPFIQAKDLPGPVPPDSDLIRIDPWWAVELFNNLGKPTAPAAPVQDEAAKAADFAAQFQSANTQPTT
ncbi:hypothetical protein RY831_23840 [Noviherbaspirillum sp. CPCC 100848]|uniref:Uncharacterized protein n=1 Tax=Noviherbaspirillum album TaxID=3080276 RepID=A0ABU6JFZ4_9BURK|nr:hypothetical protein [Noviherbaspirillum sp. CPCC 100848]MEC4722200.1 hypothetical protein [Noviherbaspirillum sp. CPCC 100848]